MSEPTRPVTRVRLGFTLCLALLAGCTAENIAQPEPQEYWQGTRTEFTQAIHDCVLERGWQVNTTTDPITRELRVEVHGLDTRDDLLAFSADSEACKESLPPIRWPETDTEYALWYENWIGRYDCMVEAGLQMLPAPSLQAWTELQRFGDGHEDATYLILGVEGDPGLWARAVSACPPDPDAFW